MDKLTVTSKMKNTWDVSLSLPHASALSLHLWKRHKWSELQDVVHLRNKVVGHWQEAGLYVEERQSWEQGKGWCREIREEKSNCNWSKPKKSKAKQKKWLLNWTHAICLQEPWKLTNQIDNKPIWKPISRIVTNISDSFDEYYVTNNIRAMHASTGFVGLSDVVLPLFTEESFFLG